MVSIELVLDRKWHVLYQYDWYCDSSGLLVTSSSGAGPVVDSRALIRLVWNWSKGGLLGISRNGTGAVVGSYQ